MKSMKRRMYEYFLNLAKQYSKINDWDFDFRLNDKITLNTITLSKIIDEFTIELSLSDFNDLSAKVEIYIQYGKHLKDFPDDNDYQELSATTLKSEYMAYDEFDNSPFAMWRTIIRELNMTIVMLKAAPNLNYQNVYIQNIERVSEKLDLNDPKCKNKFYEELCKLQCGIKDIKIDSNTVKIISEYKGHDYSYTKS